MGNARPRREAEFAVSSEPASGDANASRREHTRYRVDLDVTVESDHNFYAGFVENISSGGIFIATHRVKNVGDHIEFTINLPDEGGPITGVGEVRWLRVYSDQSNVEPGMGLKFVEIAPAAVKRIEAFLGQRDPLFYEDE